MPTEFNWEFISEKDIKEFRDSCNEFIELMDKPIDKNVNVLQFVIFVNNYLCETVEEIEHYYWATTNDFMNRHFESRDFLNYKITSIIDYCGFSIYKLHKTLLSISFVFNNNQTESIYALSRSFFENYLYICAINNNKQFFINKILPKVEDKYVYIKISDLRKYLTNKFDDELYKLFYAKACQFVHVDVLSATKYFHDNDPYTEVSPCDIAGNIALVTVFN